MTTEREREREREREGERARERERERATEKRGRETDRQTDTHTPTTSGRAERVGRGRDGASGQQSVVVCGVIGGVWGGCSVRIWEKRGR